MPSAMNHAKLGRSVAMISRSTCSYDLTAGNRTAADGTFGRMPCGGALVAMLAALRRAGRGRSVIYLLQVDHCGEGVELLEHVVRATVLDHLRDRPVRIRGVAEDDGARR